MISRIIQISEGLDLHNATLQRAVSSDNLTILPILPNFCLTILRVILQRFIVCVQGTPSCSLDAGYATANPNILNKKTRGQGFLKPDAKYKFELLWYVQKT